jgi:hypothetical protein
MRRFRPISVTTIGAMVASLQSCATSPTTPQGALIGRFGGVASEITASATGVRVRLSCDVFTAVGPIVPDSLGRFERQLKPLPGSPILAAAILGITDGATIDANAVLTYPVGPSTGQLQVRRGVKPDDRILSCVVPKA